MTGKTCLVTGATSGIGHATALGLAHMGASVVVHGRSLEKANTVAAGIRHATANPQVSAAEADFASLDEIRRLAADLHRRLPRLDVLINNAGMAAVGSRRSVTKDGYEATFAVNHLAPFLLTHLLLDLLTAAAPSRIVVVSSAAHHGAKLDFHDLMGERTGGGFQAYSRSKLANILFTRSLAKRLRDTGVTVNALHPGVVHTGLAHNSGWAYKSLMLIFGRLMRSPARGAETSLYLATSPHVEGATGGYYVDCRLVEPSAEARSNDHAERLWELSTKLVGVSRA